MMIEGINIYEHLLALQNLLVFDIVILKNIWIMFVDASHEVENDGKSL